MSSTPGLAVAERSRLTVGPHITHRGEGAVTPSRRSLAERRLVSPDLAVNGSCRRSVRKRGAFGRLWFGLGAGFGCGGGGCVVAGDQGCGRGAKSGAHTRHGKVLLPFCCIIIAASVTKVHAGPRRVRVCLVRNTPLSLGDAMIHGRTWRAHVARRMLPPPLNEAGSCL